MFDVDTKLVAPPPDPPAIATKDCPPPVISFHNEDADKLNLVQVIPSNEYAATDVAVSPPAIAVNCPAR